MSDYYVRSKQTGDVHRTSDPKYWSDCEILSRAEGKRLYREQETKALRKRLKPGATVYVVQRSVSKSGMYRRLDLYIVARGQLERITYNAAVVMDWSMNDSGIGVGGCGMDMHFHIVYTLARYLFPKGFKAKNMAGGKSEQKDGGYALKHVTI